MNNNHVYDMLVVGGGPGGYTAALYATRAGLDIVVLEKLSAGGQMALTEQIDNYPGFEMCIRDRAGASLGSGDRHALRFQSRQCKSYEPKRPHGNDLLLQSLYGDRAEHGTHRAHQH